MPNESKTPEDYVSDALDLMVKAGWVKPHVQSVEGLGVGWTAVENSQWRPLDT
jgi:hypothetical protein